MSVCSTRVRVQRTCFCSVHLNFPAYHKTQQGLPCLALEWCCLCVVASTNSLQKFSQGLRRLEKALASHFTGAPTSQCWGGQSGFRDFRKVQASQIILQPGWFLGGLLTSTRTQYLVGIIPHARWIRWSGLSDDHLHTGWKFTLHSGWHLISHESSSIFDNRPAFFPHCTLESSL